jgi:hypothetical protein
MDHPPIDSAYDANLPLHYQALGLLRVLEPVVLRQRDILAVFLSWMKSYVSNCVRSSYLIPKSADCFRDLAEADDSRNSNDPFRL